MKRVILIVVALFALYANVSAQSFKDMLKQSATELLDQATGGKATELLMVGTWNYDAPAMRLEGENELANFAGNALTTSLTSKLQKAYDVVGIKQGSCTFTFKEDNTFTALLGNRTLSGTYNYDAATHAVELNFSTLVKLGAMKGHVYLEGETLKMVFDCPRLISFVKNLGAKISLLNGITAMLDNYDNVMLGFGLKK